MRIIRKLYKRLTTQQINDSSYNNIKIEHQIVFFILDCVQKKINEKLIEYDKIAEILKKNF